MIQSVKYRDVNLSLLLINCIAQSIVIIVMVKVITIAIVMTITSQ